MVGINHDAVKVHGEVGTHTEWNADHKQKGNHDCEQYQHLNHVIENRTDWPGGPVQGQVVYRSDYNNFFGWNGTMWQSLTPVATIVVAADGTGNFTDIQDGIDALPAGGGVVYIKEGTYALAVGLTINNSFTRLVGAGMATLITTAVNITTITIGALIQNCQIDSLRIVKTGARGGIGIDVLGNDAIIMNCFARGKTLGVKVNNAYSCQIVGTNISDCVDAVEIVGVVGIEMNTIVTRCSLYANDDNGIVLDNTELNTILGNQIFMNGDNGIVCKATCDYNTINTNTLWDNANDGIELTATSDRNSLVGNVSYDNGANGINIVNANCNKNIVVSNVMYNNTAAQFVDNGTLTEVGHNITT